MRPFSAKRWRCAATYPSAAATAAHHESPTLKRPRRPSLDSVRSASAAPATLTTPQPTATSMAAVPLQPLPPPHARSRTVTIAVVGDVHEQWDAESEAALASLGADVCVFVGDFGEENLALVERVAAVPHPKAVMLGNHDAWFSLTPRGRQRAVRVALMSSTLRSLAGGVGGGVAAQLAALGSDHIGFSSKHFPHLDLSMVGARPFSKGGRRWDDVAAFYSHHYGVQSFQDSAHTILDAALSQRPGCALVVVAHNGPTGLGEQRFAPCGVDWQQPEGDHGDPDLQEALEAMAGQGRPASLVLFGHMHASLKEGGRRDMAHVDPATGTVYLNAAVVPRVRRFPAAPAEESAAAAGDGRVAPDVSGAAASGGWERRQQQQQQQQRRGHHFLVVQMQGGVVSGARHVWVAAPASDAAATTSGAESSSGDDGRTLGPIILEEEAVIKTAAAGDGSGRVVCSYFRAHTQEWTPVVVEAAAVPLS